MENNSNKEMIVRPSTGTVGGLRWFEFYENQRVGRFVGGVASGLGLAGLGLALFGKRSDGKTLWGVSGAILSGLGLWLLRKKYFRDPEALREYLLKFKQLSVLSNIQEFGWDNIWKIASTELFVEKLMSEVGSQKVGFDDIWQLYGDKNLEKMLELALLPPQFLVSKLHQDIGLVGMSDPSAISRPLIKRFNEYAAFLLQRLAVDKDFLGAALLSDPNTQRMQFEELVQHGARTLLKMEVLKLEFLHERFMNELRMGVWTWSNVQDKFGPWILDEAIAMPEEVAPVFRNSAFLTMAFTEMIEAFWPWPLQKYALRIGVQPDEYQKVLELRQEWETLKSDHENVVATTKTAYTREELALQTTLTQKIAKIDSEIETQRRTLMAGIVDTQKDIHQASAVVTKRQDLNDLDKKKTTLKAEAEAEATVAIAKVANTRDSAISKADTKLAEHKARINKDWMQFLGSKFNPRPTAALPSSNNTNVNITLNLGGVLNQPTIVAAPQQPQLVASAPPL